MAQHFPIICWTFSYLIVMWFHWSSMSCLWDYIYFVITLSFAVQLSERQSSFSLYGNGLHLTDVGWCWCHVAAWFIKSMGSWSISTSIQPLCMEVTGVHSASECRIVFSAYCMIKKNPDLLPWQCIYLWTSLWNFYKRDKNDDDNTHRDCLLAVDNKCYLYDSWVTLFFV